MTSPIRGSHVLIGQSSLFDIAGSEVVTHEIARHFVQEGATLTVVAFGFSDEWRARFEALPGTTLWRYDDPDLVEELRAHRPDIAWIHHGVIPQPLLREPGRTRFVFHHMSAYQSQEFPHSPRIEGALASAIVFPAPETLDAQVATGLYAGIDAAKLSVLGNPAPDAFARDEQVAADTLRRLLVVSNHPPAELEEALGPLTDAGVEVVRFGGSATDPAPKRLVTPDDIHGVDAVVSIGKTVQYSLVAGVPVYVYDHFGGPGWLTENDFEAARYANFSGRGFTQRAGGEIAAELLDGFRDAQTTAEVLRARYGAEFRLSGAIDRVLDTLPDEPEHGTFDDVELAAGLLRGDLMNGMINAVEARTLTVKDLTTRLDLLQRKSDVRVAEYEVELTATKAELAHLSNTPGVRTATKFFDAASRAKHSLRKG